MEKGTIKVPELASEALKRLKLKYRGKEEWNAKKNRPDVVIDCIEFHGDPADLDHIFILYLMALDAYKDSPGEE